MCIGTTFSVSQIFTALILPLNSSDAPKDPESIMGVLPEFKRRQLAIDASTIPCDLLMATFDYRFLTKSISHTHGETWMFGSRQGEDRHLLIIAKVSWQLKTATAHGACMPPLLKRPRETKRNPLISVRSHKLP